MDMSKYASAAGFIGVDDVKAGQKETITDVKLGNFDKPVVEFESGAKLSLNKTNVRKLIEAFGEDSRDWTGCAVELSAGEINYQGASTRCVLVTPLVEADALPKPAAAKKSSPTKTGDDMDEAIPFS